MRKPTWLNLFIALAVVVAIVPAATAQEEDWAPVVVRPGEPIKIGFAAALTGAGIDVLGIDEQRGAQLALEDINAAGGILGFEVVMDFQDEQCSAEGGATVANRFVSDESIVAVVGHMCSSSCVAGQDIYADYGYSMVSPSCTGVVLTDPERVSPIFSRVAWTDRGQGPAAAQFLLEELGVTTVATIHDGSPYGQGLVVAMADAFIDLGGDVIAELAVNVGDTDMTAVLNQIKDAGPPDAIYFVGFPAEGAYLARQRIDVGMEDVIFMGADGINAVAYVEAAGEAGCGTFASAADPAELEGGGYEAFVERYIEAYGESPTAPFHAHAYDATMVIAKAIEAVGEIDSEGNLVIDRVALRDAIRATEGLQGLTGTLTCDEYGDCAGGAAITVVEVMCEGDERAFETIWSPPAEEEE